MVKSNDRTWFFGFACGALVAWVGLIITLSIAFNSGGVWSVYKYSVQDNPKYDLTRELMENEYINDVNYVIVGDNFFVEKLQEKIGKNASVSSVKLPENTLINIWKTIMNIEVSPSTKLILQDAPWLWSNLPLSFTGQNQDVLFIEKKNSRLLKFSTKNLREAVVYLKLLVSNQKKSVSEVKENRPTDMSRATFIFKEDAWSKQYYLGNINYKLGKKISVYWVLTDEVLSENLNLSDDFMKKYDQLREKSFSNYQNHQFVDLGEL
jgi:hypothetical protein